MVDVITPSWTVILVPTALAASLLVLAQSVASHASAYSTAPQELGHLLETMRDAAIETKTYERDISRVSRMEDKVRLGSLLREIQKSNLALSSDLALLLEGDQLEEEKLQALLGLPHIKDRIFMPIMKLTARILWLEHRSDIHDRLRRLDTLKMRFLVVYMGAVASNAHAAAAASVAAAAAVTVASQNSQPITPPMTPRKDERMLLMQSIAASAAAAREVPKLRSSREALMPARRPYRQISSASTARPHTPPRSTVSAVSTPSASTHERFQHSPTGSISSVVSVGAADPKTDGWSGVVAELRKSPRMEARRESIETAMRSLF